ncbi:MAG: hypothetical protein JW724_06575 [Candidatus Altiarchaeota archaeon]|nr:hypothetical protein [Candidatus Altiarchaeota archaeon]
MTDECTLCRGKKVVACPRCTEKNKKSFMPGITSGLEDCSKCDGTGEIECPMCHGTGKS